MTTLRKPEHLLHHLLDTWVSSRIDKFEGRPVTVRENARAVIMARQNRLIYNRIPKNANSTMMQVMKSVRKSEDHFLRLRSRPLKLAHSFNSAQSLLEEHDWLVIIRNPYARILSAFLDKLEKPWYQERFGTYELTADGFTQFLLYLQKSGTGVNMHFEAQTRLLYLPIHYFNIRIPFEDINNTVLSYFEALGLRDTLGEGFLQRASKLGTHHRTNSNERIVNFYTPESLALVNELYKKDFTDFGYKMVNQAGQIDDSISQHPEPLIHIRSRQIG